MPLENSLNVSPYYDDQNEEKDFYRVLFKPGVAVQTRELNQLQALLQTQIERFGNHVFKSGTILSGVNFNYLPTYSYVKILDVQVDGQPSLPSGYVNFFVKSTLNLTARVLDYKDGLESSNPDLKTIYVRYTNSSDPDPANSSAVYTEFAPNEQLTIFGEDYPIFKINVLNGGVGFSNSDTVIIQSALKLANVSGSFTNGEVITQSTTGAKGVIKAINTTAIACTTILSIAPRTQDLTNTSVNAVAWSFGTPYSITGNTSSATANVVGLIGSGSTGLLTTDTSGIIQSITVGDGGEDYIFLPWVTIKTSNATATVQNLDLVAQNYKARITVANTTVNAIGTGYAFGVSEGVIYQKGHFLRVEKQSIIIDKYTTTPNNVAVGFKTVENYVDSNEDESLLDNASGTTNYTAPGADRLQLTPVLTTLTLEQAAANVDFFALAEWKDGLPYKENRTTVFTTIADELARRSQETNGNYVIDRFNVTTKEKATANVDYVDVVIDPGTAYIEGYRVSTRYNNYLNVARSSTTTNLSSQSITVNYGNYAIVNELAGIFDFKAGAAIDLYDTSRSLISRANNTILTTSNGVISPVIPSVTFNANTSVANSTDFITISSHGYRDGDVVRYTVDAGNTAVSGLSNGSTYYVVSSNTTGFKLAATSGGSAIDITAGVTETGHNISSAGTKIGTARIRSLVLDSGEPGTAEATYRAYLFDIDMNSGYSFRDVKTIYSNGGTQDGIADVVRTQDATINANVAKLYDVSRNQLLFPVKSNAVKSISNISYIYRTVSNTSPQFATAGTLQLGPLGAGFEFPYSPGTLSATQEKDFVAIPTVPFEASANITGTSVAIYANTLIVGTGTTFISDLAPGDFIRCANGSANQYLQIASLANNTHGYVKTVPIAMTAANVTLYFPALYPISFGRTTRSINVSSNTTTAILNLGVTTNATATAVVMYNVRAVNKLPVTKTINRDVFVKIHTSNNAGSNTGPWSLGLPGVVRLKNVYLGNSTSVGTTTNTTVSDVTKYFVVDGADDENSYRLAQLKLKTVPSALAVNTNQFILAKVDVFTKAAGSEGVYTIGSYSINDTANLASSSNTVNILELPELYTTQGAYVDVRNSFDFRPYASNTANVATTVGGATVNPANTFDLNTAEKYFPAPDSTLTFEASYYNKRKDRVVVTSNGSFKVIQGTPNLNDPVAPDEPDHSVTLAVLSIPPYPSLPSVLNQQTTVFAGKEVVSQDTLISQRFGSSTITIDTPKNINDAQNRVYTMQDIGLIDRRLSIVENAVSLNFIEQKIKELVIPSGITLTTNRFKNAFFVDPFNDDSKSDLTHREYKAKITAQKGILEPSFTQINIESDFDLSDTDTNACVVNGFAMLPYTTEVLINQNIKNIAINGDGQDVRFIGSGSVSPASFSIKSRGERIITEDAPPPPPPAPSRPWWKFW